MDSRHAKRLQWADEDEPQTRGQLDEHLATLRQRFTEIRGEPTPERTDRNLAPQATSPPRGQAVKELLVLVATVACLAFAAFAVLSTVRLPRLGLPVALTIAGVGMVACLLYAKSRGAERR
jgi:hypothetical protein